MDLKFEFWAQFNLYEELNKDEFQNKNILDGMVNKISNELPKDWELLDNFSRLQILAATLASNKTVKWIDKGKERKISVKDYARTGALQYKEKSGLLYWYDEGNYQEFLKEHLCEMGDILNLTNNHDTVGPSFLDISMFPSGSWTIQIHFTLRKPYISKDDVDFYIVDNPVKKEWVFKVPYVAPSQWKGALRAAMMRELVDDLRSGQKNEVEFIQARLRLYRLFGNEKDGTEDFLNRALTLHRVGHRPEDEHQAQEWAERYKQTYDQVAREFEEKVRAEGYRKENVEGFQGRLHFYPTFFDRIGLEVINPHPRDTGAGKQPIYFECVPAGTPGVFTLLYVPIDRVGRSSPEAMESEAKADLEAVARGVRAMLTQYGFGAKTSSGYGVADVLKDQSQVVPPDSEEIFWKAWEKNDV